MNIAAGRQYRLFLLGLWAAILPGCTLPAWVPFQGPVSDHIPGLVTPAEKIAQLQKLAGKAGESDAPTKHQVAVELAASIRNESDSLIRTEIIRTLARYPDPAGDPILEKALSDPDADVRMAACEALGKRGGPQAAAALAPLLSGDVNHDVRLAAARALGKIKDPHAVDALGDALLDSDPAMQYRAVLSLHEATGKDLGNDVDRWRQYVKEERSRTGRPNAVAEKNREVY